MAIANITTNITPPRNLHVNAAFMHSLISPALTGICHVVPKLWSDIHTPQHTPSSACSSLRQHTLHGPMFNCLYLSRSFHIGPKSKRKLSASSSSGTNKRAKAPAPPNPKKRTRMTKAEREAVKAQTEKEKAEKEAAKLKALAEDPALLSEEGEHTWHIYF
jgi:hypothetical protein